MFTFSFTKIVMRSLGEKTDSVFITEYACKIYLSDSTSKYKTPTFTKIKEVFVKYIPQTK